MKTTIRFWFNENLIFSIDDAVDTFKIGQIICFTIEEYYPKTTDKLKLDYSQALINALIDTNEFLIQNYNHKNFKIIKKNTFLNKNSNNENKYLLNIDYDVKQYHSYQWKWWYIKSHVIHFLKSIFKSK